MSVHRRIADVAQRDAECVHMTQPGTTPMRGFTVGIGSKADLDKGLVLGDRARGATQGVAAAVH